MKWQEIIQIRTFSEQARQAARQQAEELRPPQSKDRPQAMEVLYRKDVETDICLLLRWDTRDQAPGRSGLGQQIARMFSEYGWVNHSVWSKPERQGASQPCRRR